MGPRGYVWELLPAVSHLHLFPRVMFVIVVCFVIHLQLRDVQSQATDRTAQFQKTLEELREQLAKAHARSEGTRTDQLVHAVRHKRQLAAAVMGAWAEKREQGRLIRGLQSWTRFTSLHRAHEIAEAARESEVAQTKTEMKEVFVGELQRVREEGEEATKVEVEACEQEWRQRLDEHAAMAQGDVEATVERERLWKAQALRSAAESLMYVVKVVEGFDRTVRVCFTMSSCMRYDFFCVTDH